jgi:hypothetical protein
MTPHSRERLGAPRVVQNRGSDKPIRADLLEIRRAADLTRQSAAFSCQRAMSNVVGRAPVELSRPHRRQRVRAVERLTLRLSRGHRRPRRPGGFLSKPTMSRTLEGG